MPADTKQSFPAKHVNITPVSQSEACCLSAVLASAFSFAQSKRVFCRCLQAACQCLDTQPLLSWFLQDSLYQDCHTLGLPHSGKKADLAATLVEAAKEAGSQELQRNVQDRKQAKTDKVPEESKQVLKECNHLSQLLALCLRMLHVQLY